MRFRGGSFRIWTLFACCSAFNLDTSTKAAAASPRGGEVSIRWVIPGPARDHPSVLVSGLDEETLHRLEVEGQNWQPGKWHRVLAIYAGSAEAAAEGALPPMLGTYRVEPGGLRFEPRFPLEPGIVYRAVFMGDPLDGDRSFRRELASATFTLPRPTPVPSTRVLQVYPSSDDLPENVLKFYIHFSAPMRRGDVYQFIHLRDEQGKDVELPFLEINEELWDPTMTRLTLFMDPGRIKRGVRPLEEIGPALKANSRYTLLIDAAWTDADGNPLKKPFVKRFKVHPPDRQPLDPVQWRIRPPKAGTRQALEVEFPESVDHALAQRMIAVVGQDKRRLEGSCSMTDHEKRWGFTPVLPWSAGAYRLSVATTIEDLAGNNIGKAFEVDRFESVQTSLSGEAIELGFEIR